MTNFVAYVRVSTDRQGKSGLGLEAQRELINVFIGANPGAKLLCPVFTEIESGKNDDRPELAKAIARCHQTGATLLISKLDRLARSVSFIANLMKAVDFRVADMPQATPFELHIRASVAEEEGRMISARTRAALAVAKARGKKLGGDRGYRLPRDPERETRTAKAAGEAHIRNANRFASEVSVIVAEIQASGVTSHNGIAEALTARGATAPRRGDWTATSVRRLLARIAGLA